VDISCKPDQCRLFFYVKQGSKNLDQSRASHFCGFITRTQEAQMKIVLLVISVVDTAERIQRVSRKDDQRTQECV
jgi:hypothetical protein